MALTDEMVSHPEHPAHGTARGYSTGHCRCGRCREAIATAARHYRAGRDPLSADDDRHGTLYAYSAFKCRCPKCSQARRNYAEIERTRHAQRAQSAGKVIETRRRPDSFSREQALGALVRFMNERQQQSRDDYTAWRATQDWPSTPSGHAIKTLFGSWPQGVHAARQLQHDQS